MAYSLLPLFAEPSGWLAGLASGGAFAIAAVCWFMLSNLARGDHEMIGGKNAQRLWRVYSVMSATFVSIGCALLYYALFARFGAGQSFRTFDSGAEKFIGWLLFGLGFVLLPVFLSEFALAKISVDMGFTLRYEENIFQRLPHWEEIYHTNTENFPFWEKLIDQIQKLSIWLVVYVFSSVLGFQLYWNWRNEWSQNDSTRKKLFQFFKMEQRGVDIHVMTSLQVVLAIMWALLFTSAEFKAMSAILLAYVVIVYFYFLFFVATTLNLSGSDNKKLRVVISLLGTLYFALLLVDMFGHRLIVEWSWLAEGYKFAGQWANGLLPWYLLLLGIYLGARFIEDWLEITQLRKKFLEEKLGELLLMSSNVDMVARLVHRVGNRLQAPLGALGAIAPEMMALSELSSSLRWNLLGQQAQIGLKSLQGLKKELDDFKQGTRLQYETRWLDAGATLREVSGEVGISEDSINAPYGVEILAHLMDFKETLRNLLVNAKYEVHKSASPQIFIRMFKTNEQYYPLCIEVCDNGAGFTADKRDRIFLPYFSTKSEGSGLGMYLAYSFMHNIQGKIRAESRTAGDKLDNVPNWVNTRFILEFPENRIRFR